MSRAGMRATAFGLAGSLVVALIVVGLLVTRQGTKSSLVAETRAGCLRATADRLDTARKDAADVMRERLLERITSGAESAAHRSSAAAALEAAHGYLERAGIDDVRQPEAIRGLDPDSRGVRAARVAFCARAFTG